MDTHKAFQELIKRYESIKLKEIPSDHFFQSNPFGSWCAANSLTGFGNCMACILCREVNYINDDSCVNCSWVLLTGSACNAGRNESTYTAISHAISKKLLFKAFKNRAKYMRSVLDGQ